MKRILFFIALCLSLECAEAQRTTVGTFNIRNKNERDVAQGDGWDTRMPWVVELIRYHEFELLGLQEVLDSQMTDLKTFLPEYDAAGVGRDDGKRAGEYSPIFFLKSRYSVEDWGTIWLSETPDRPSMGWDAACPRICTWARLTDKTYKRTVWMFNLHMDHVGVNARKNGARLVLKTIQEKCSKADCVVCTGDFNVDQTNELYTLLTKSGVVQDSYMLSPIRYMPAGTPNHFHAEGNTESRIDHVLISGPWTATRWGVLTDTYRTELNPEDKTDTKDFPKEVYFRKCVVRTPSDHYPVRVILEYGPRQKHMPKCKNCPTL